MKLTLREKWMRIKPCNKCRHAHTASWKKCNRCKDFDSWAKGPSSLFDVKSKELIKELRRRGYSVVYAKYPRIKKDGFVDQRYHISGRTPKERKEYENKKRVR